MISFFIVLPFVLWIHSFPTSQSSSFLARDKSLSQFTVWAGWHWILTTYTERPCLRMMGFVPPALPVHLVVTVVLINPPALCVWLVLLPLLFDSLKLLQMLAVMVYRLSLHPLAKYTGDLRMHHRCRLRPPCLDRPEASEPLQAPQVVWTCRSTRTQQSLLQQRYCLPSDLGNQSPYQGGQIYK